MRYVLLSGKEYYSSALFFIFTLLPFTNTHALPPGPFIEPEKVWQQGANPAYPLQEAFYFLGKVSFVDLDLDGDLDLMMNTSRTELIGIGGWYEDKIGIGSLLIYKNIGTAIEPAFITYSHIDIPPSWEYDKRGGRLPAALDLDNDGDLDMVVGMAESSTLTYFENIGSPTAPEYIQRHGADNPWDGMDVGEIDEANLYQFDRSRPSPLDLDGDGDLDLLVTGAESGTLVYFENIGNPTVAKYIKRSGADNPWDGIKQFHYPAVLDVDGDGDWDLVGSCYPGLLDLNDDSRMDAVGCHDGSLNQSLLYLENIGDPTTPRYISRSGAANPWDGFENLARPSVSDLDGDGDADLTAEFTRLDNKNYFIYLENSGSPTAPRYVIRDGAENPWHGADVGTDSAPTALDADGDGDNDVVVGDFNGALHYFENIGDAKAPRFIERRGADNPWDGLVAKGYLEWMVEPIAFRATPSALDLDADGDWDLMAGNAGGTLNYFENTGTPTAPRYIEREGVDNPWNGIAITYIGDWMEADEEGSSHPAPLDVDGDGDIDVVVASARPYLTYLENIGTPSAPRFMEREGADNPFATLPELIGHGMNTLAAADMDGDGDKDLWLEDRCMVKGYYREPCVRYLENTGASTFIARTWLNPPWRELTNPASAFFDMDGDGDADALIGHNDGTFRYFENKNLPAHERAFNWAESVAPELLPPPGEAFELPQMSLRYYAASGVYLFYHSTDGQVYLFAPPYAEWQALGALENYAEAILAAGF